MGTGQDLMGISRVLRARIKEAIKMTANHIQVIESDSVWSISSSSNTETNYFIVKKASECGGMSDNAGFESECGGLSDNAGFELFDSHDSGGPCIAFKLAKCCRHTLSCSCGDYLNGHTCKHI